MLDGPEFFLAHDGKDAIWGTGRRMKFEIQRNDIRRAITEVIEAEKELINNLEWVVTWSEGKNCV